MIDPLEQIAGFPSSRAVSQDDGNGGRGIWLLAPSVEGAVIPEA